MHPYKIILNPISGRGTGKDSDPLIKRHLADLGLDFDIVWTERPWHAAELAFQAAQDGYDVVVAAGGDGTVNEAINGLMRARQEGRDGIPALGVLCVGRGNDFAFGCGIPRDLAAGCETLAQGKRCAIDVGYVSGEGLTRSRYFGNGVGIGFDAVVGFESLKLKRLHGFASYLVAALKTIFLYDRAPQVRIECDHRSTTLPALLVSIMNGRRMGGGFMMTPGSLMDDGLFDLCIGEEVNRLRILTLILQVMMGNHTNQRPITMERARRVTVTALRGTLPAHADGELLCTEAQRMSMELYPAQMEVLCAPQQENLP
ncbi:MAG: diacylglycerol/lipid kinase family protein [Anaerolineae bacterium]